MAFDPSTDRASVEAFYTARRLVELRLRPVQGRFDIQHLQEINRRIFQDMPGLGFANVTPGKFRDPVPSGRDWVKHRRLEEVGISTHVAYSPMDETSRAKLADRLTEIEPKTLAGLTTEGFGRFVAKLYTNLDYIHPFSDGNSRTLREFTRQLADAAGFELRWETFGQSRGGRDVLYVARDLSVNRQALPQVQHEDTRRDLTFTLDQLEGNRDLTSLLLSAGKHVLRPKRAVAFEERAEADAVKGFPELAPLYRQLEDAERRSHEALPQSVEGRTKLIASVRQRIQQALDAGEMTLTARVHERERPRPQSEIER